jgi:hypothetical protein
VRFEFLQCFGRVIDQGETSCLSTTELGLETENVDLVLVGLVEFRKLGSQVVLGDVGTVGVEDITVGPSESSSRFDALSSSGKILVGLQGQLTRPFAYGRGGDCV